jgi:hypothetical protein
METQQCVPFVMMTDSDAVNNVNIESVAMEVQQCVLFTVTPIHVAANSTEHS